MLTSPVTVQRALLLADQLTSDSTRLDAELLLCHVLAKPRTYLYAWPEALLTEAQKNAFIGLIARRKKGEPVAFILGKKDFWSLELEVEPSTLIPRPDTELLVECALEFIPNKKNTNVLDLGTGTGAIALAIAKERKSAHVTAVDYSQPAVALAQRNANNNNINNVTVMRSNWFECVSGQYHVIVSNPPYIDANDPHLNEGDVVFEPATALIAKDNGLADIKHIATHAINYLMPGGVLLFEHGWQQAASVQKILNALGFSAVQSWRDINQIERVTAGVYKAQK